MGAESNHQPVQHSLLVDVLTARDLGAPASRVFDMTRQRFFGSSLHAYVELKLGDSKSQTACGINSEDTDEIDFGNAQVFFEYHGELQLTVRVRDRRVVQAFFRGHP